MLSFKPSFILPAWDRQHWIKADKIQLAKSTFFSTIGFGASTLPFWGKHSKSVTRGSQVSRIEWDSHSFESSVTHSCHTLYYSCIGKMYNISNLYIYIYINIFPCVPLSSPIRELKKKEVMSNECSQSKTEALLYLVKSQGNNQRKKPVWYKWRRLDVLFSLEIMSGDVTLVCIQNLRAPITQQLLSWLKRQKEDEACR